MFFTCSLYPFVSMTHILLYWHVLTTLDDAHCFHVLPLSKSLFSTCLGFSFATCSHFSTLHHLWCMFSMFCTTNDTCSSCSVCQWCSFCMPSVLCDACLLCVLFINYFVLHTLFDICDACSVYLLHQWRLFYASGSICDVYSSGSVPLCSSNDACSSCSVHS